MSTKHETLADFVRRMCHEKKISYRQVADASGGQISHASVAEIANGTRKNPSVAVLNGLAKGLGVPSDDLGRIARGLPPNPSDEIYEIYAERFNAEDISETEWQYLELFFRQQVDRFRFERPPIASASLPRANKTKSQQKAKLRRVSSRR